MAPKYLPVHDRAVARSRLLYALAVVVAGAVVAVVATTRMESGQDAAITLGYFGVIGTLIAGGATAAANNPGFYPMSGAGPWLRVGRYFMFVPLVLLAGAVISGASWLLSGGPLPQLP